MNKIQHKYRNKFCWLFIYYGSVRTLLRVEMVRQKNTQTGRSSVTLTVSAVDVALFDKWISTTAKVTIKWKVHPRTNKPKEGAEI